MVNINYCIKDLRRSMNHFKYHLAQNTCRDVMPCTKGGPKVEKEVKALLAICEHRKAKEKRTIKAVAAPMPFFSQYGLL